MSLSLRDLVFPVQLEKQTFKHDTAPRGHPRSAWNYLVGLSKKVDEKAATKKKRRRLHRPKDTFEGDTDEGSVNKRSKDSSQSSVDHARHRATRAGQQAIRDNQPVHDIKLSTGKELKIRFIPSLSLEEQVSSKSSPRNVSGSSSIKREPSEAHLPILETVKFLNRPFECPQCLFKFTSQSTADRHLKTHRDNSIIECYFCALVFDTLDELRAHVTQHLAVSSPFSCNECGSSFPNRQGFIKHMLSVHGHINPKSSQSSSNNVMAMQVKCAVCGISCPDEKFWISHIISHGKTSETECLFCLKPISGDFSIEQHVKENHLSPRPFFCYKCGVNKKSQSTLRLHMKSHFTKQDKASPSSGRLRSNSDNSSWPQGVSPSVKKFSSSFFESEQYLSRPFECRTCLHRSLKQTHLNLHLKRHEDPSIHECYFCFQKFPSYDSMKTHANEFHVGETPFNCFSCSLQFASKASLRKHFAESHPQLYQP